MATQKMKGITIEINGETTGLQDSLKGVNDKLYQTQGELNQVNKLLKLDPKNVTLLTQKQGLLTTAIKDTTSKLQSLQEAKRQAEASGNVDKNSKSYRELEREIEATQQKLSGLNEQAKNVSNNLAGASNNGLKFGDVLKANIISDVVMSSLKSVVNLTKQLSNSFVDLIKSGVEYNMQMESYTASFTAMLGDEQKAQEVLKQIKQDASRSPFDIESLVQANQMLLTTGASAEESQKVILALGDAVAYTGGGNAELSRMASNLQQIKNIGKASAMDIKQFGNAGINIYGLLAKSMGKSIEKVKDMDITYEQLTKALIEASEEGGMYFNGMANQANTMSGQITSLKSSFNDLTGVIANDTTNALSNKFLPTLNDTIQAMSKGMEEEGVGGMSKALGEGLEKLSPFVSEFIPEFMGMGAELINGIADGLLTTDESGRTMLESTLAGMTENLIKFVASSDFLEKLYKVGKSIISGIFTGIKNAVKGNWFMEALVNGLDLWGGLAGDLLDLVTGNYKGGTITRVSSGGFGALQSGGYGITLNSTINVNSNGSIDNSQVRQWARIMADEINEELGARL